MNDNQFNQQMKKLKKQYEQMPTKSSSDHIMSAVLKEKKPRRTTLFRNWRVAVSLSAAVGIGTILSMGGFFQGGTDQFTTIEEEREQEQNGEEVAIFQSDIEGENVIIKNEEERDSDEPSDESSMELENPVELGETREETFLMEGQEDVNEVIEFTDREIGFRSVVQSGFDIEGKYRENGYSLQLSADYGDGMIEPPFYTMRKYYNGSAEEVADGLYSELEEDGFVRNEESSLTITGRQSAFEEVTDERLYMRGDESVQLAVILNDDTVYSIKIHTTTEYTEGLQIRVGQVLEHFQWIN
ncbi:hypothetical protein AB3N04_02300 [Alkalihalophilus sp. As8PL]|uniref:DUF4367 domain-containing protein n=1 Tax=Alkalihalophilus sp. As8PL TaxID=3237103 RepID=A0AB39BU85_9BACI